MDYKKISIRGRFAYALKCLDQFGKAYPANNLLHATIVFKYSEFPSSLELSEWYDECKEFSPSFYNLYGDKALSRIKYINKELASGIKSYYDVISSDFKDLYQLTFDIAAEHLFSTVSDDATVEMLSRIIYIVKKNGIVMPDFSRIEFSLFSENRGWGRKFFWEDIWP